MTQTERFSLATHLYVRLRRSTGRVVDAVWMAQNDEYAREILRLAAADPDPETRGLAQRFLPLLDGGRPAPRKLASPAARGEVNDEVAQHYIGTLR
jgi:hypothetical protein